MVPPVAVPRRGRLCPETTNIAHAGPKGKQNRSDYILVTRLNPIMLPTILTRQALRVHGIILLTRRRVVRGVKNAPLAPVMAPPTALMAPSPYTQQQKAHQHIRCMVPIFPHAAIQRLVIVVAKGGMGQT